MRKDGTEVPYFLVKREGTATDGDTPTLLCGYGGFEISLGPRYVSDAVIAWLEQGGAYVEANIKGGGRVRSPLASGRPQGRPQQIVRGLRRRGGGSYRNGTVPTVHVGDSGRVKRRAPGGEHVHHEAKTCSGRCTAPFPSST